MNGETNGDAEAHHNRDDAQPHAQQQNQAQHPGQQQQQQQQYPEGAGTRAQDDKYAYENTGNNRMQQSTILGSSMYQSELLKSQATLGQSQRTNGQQPGGGMQESEPSQSHYEVPNQNHQNQNVVHHQQHPNGNFQQQPSGNFQQDQPHDQLRHAATQNLAKPAPILYENQNKEFLNKKASNYNLLCALEHDKKFVLKQKEGATAMKKLFFVSCICFMFMIIEAVGGYISGSIAILADAAHMFSDVAGFMISFFSIYISNRKISLKHSMGHHRAEVLGALASVFFIWALLIWLNWTATFRIINGQEPIDARLMLITACFGLGCNLLNLLALNFFCNSEGDDDDFPDEEISDVKSRSTRSLADQMTGIYKPRHAKSFEKKKTEQPGQNNILPDARKQLIEEHERQKNEGKTGENLAQRAAVIHLLGDMVQSIGVISAAIIIYVKPEYEIADPICTYIFSVLVLMTTVPIFNDCIKMIMEESPDEIDTIGLYNEILQIKTVQEIHDFHCWQLAGGKYMASMHVRSRYNEKVISDINKVCGKKEYGVNHVTVQVEPEVDNHKQISCNHLCAIETDEQDSSKGKKGKKGKK